MNRRRLVKKSPSYRPRCSYASATLCATLLRSVRSSYDLATTSTFPRRLCYLGIAHLGASATLPLPAFGVLANFRPDLNAFLKLVLLF